MFQQPIYFSDLDAIQAFRLRPSARLPQTVGFKDLCLGSSVRLPPIREAIALEHMGSSGFGAGRDVFV